MLHLIPGFLFGSGQLLLGETLLAFLLLPAACVVPRFWDNWFRALELRLGNLARHPKTCVILSGMSVLVIRSVLSLSPLLPVRAPQVHDEFSYLLAAKTFLAGRLTNPTHPMWTHLESLHIIHQPTYMSMYPPAQGLMLALGMALGGGAWLGVGLSVALMCSAICWMLQGWFPPAWAIWGVSLTIMQLGIFNYWATTYWGGAVAATAGALVLGCLPRITRNVRTRYAVLLAVGVAVLANSRPYEGLLLCIPCGIFLLRWLLRESRWRNPVVVRTFLLPLFAVLLLCGSITSYYFWRVTGSPWRMPYRVNQASYATTNPFFWQNPRPIPVYRHKVMRDYYRSWELASYTRLRTYRSRVKEVAAKMRDLWQFFLGPVLTIPLLGLLRTAKDRRTRFLLVTCLVMLAGLAPVFWLTVPHYAAPMTAAVFAVLVQSARHMDKMTWRSRPAGRFLVRTVPLVCVAALAARISAPAFFDMDYGSYSWCCVGPGNVARELMERELRAQGARNLVIVRYQPNHLVSNEWVYNDADIDGSPVVWAREMTTEDNIRLVSYFRDRTAWLAEPDLSPPRITRWEPAPQTVSVHTFVHVPARHSYTDHSHAGIESETH
jgi:hypothetical protein